MPSIDQLEVSAETMAPLPSTVEVFDKFTSEVEENGKDSDSEESFHFMLDEEEGPDNSQTPLPSVTETEEDILNKFDNLSEEPSAPIDPHDEDTILDESDSLKVNKGEGSANNTQVNICSKLDEHYETSGDGEFKSVYEVDSDDKQHEAVAEPEKEVQDVSDNKEVEESGSGDVEKVEEPTVEKKDDSAAEDVDMPEAKTQPEEKKNNSTEDTRKVDEDVDMPEAQPQTEQNDNIDSSKEKPFKAPAEPKSEDDDADLLDVSMVRETEEDDACAIADALEDQEKQDQTNEKSDEEQSDRTDAEQEGNDNSVGFDDLDSNEADTTVVENKEEDEADATVSENKEEDDADATVMENKEEVISKPAESESSEEKVVEPVNEDVPVPVCESPKPCDNKNNEESVSEKVSEEVKPMEVQTEDTSRATTQAEQQTEEEINDITPKTPGKRSHSFTELTPTKEDTSQAKKPKLVVDLDAEIPSSKIAVPPPQFQTLSGFAEFMKCRKLTSKLSRSDLEQFGLQKASECIMLRSSEGEFHQALRRYEKVIETMRKDMQQLMKQCKDLEIVNKKLMGEIRSQNGNKKPLVPLKITRSVGLQVRLNPGNELINQARRRQPVPVTPPKAMLTPNRGKAPTVVRQVLQTGAGKLPATTTQTTPTSPMLSQALQKRPVIAKRTTPVKKTSDIVTKPTAPGVIDLTDEDDKVGRSVGVGSTIKIVNKPATPTVTPNKPANASKTTPVVKTVASQQGKQTGASPKSGANTGTNKGNTVSPGIRLTPTSVITTTANGSPQMVYVVPTLASNASGQQKVAFVNFQPTNGLTLNGSTMISNKPGQTLTLKTVSVRQKHPAPLPVVQRFTRDPKLKPVLPKPHLTIKKIDTGIILQWKMPYNLDLYENIASYQLYAYQETSAPPSTDMWRKVGDVKALALPMACTLTQFADKNKYYFAVRSVDVHKRIGAFSDPEEISL